MATPVVRVAGRGARVPVPHVTKATAAVNTIPRLGGSENPGVLIATHIVSSVIAAKLCTKCSAVLLVLFTLPFFFIVPPKAVSYGGYHKTT